MSNPIRSTFIFAVLAAISSLPAQAQTSFPVARAIYNKTLESRAGFPAELSEIQLHSDLRNSKPIQQVQNATVDSCIQAQLKELDKAQSRLGITNEKAKEMVPFTLSFRISLSDLSSVPQDTMPLANHRVTAFSDEMSMIELRASMKGGTCQVVTADSLVKELSFRLGSCAPVLKPVSAEVKSATGTQRAN